jgi:hypothetical protein
MQVDTGAFQNLAAEVAALGARLDTMNGTMRDVARAALQLDGPTVPDPVPAVAGRRVGKHADRHGLHVIGGQRNRAAGR